MVKGECSIFGTILSIIDHSHSRRSWIGNRKRNWSVAIPIAIGDQIVAQMLGTWWKSAS